MSLGRKSPTLLLKWRRPLDFRQAIWDQIRTADGAFALRWLSDVTKHHPRTIRSYLQCLLAGCVVSIDNGGLYRLVRDTGIHAPRLRTDGTPVEQGRGRAGAWRAMRVLKRFTVLEIHNACGATRVDIQSFCKYLVKAGYLKATVKGTGRAASYLLVKDTGPQPPQVTRVKCVFDPNLGIVIWPTAETEAEVIIEGAP